MRMYDIILKKRANLALTNEEIRFVIEGYVHGTIPDYQVSALLMTIVFNGMNARELGTLTLSMAQSGQMVDLSSIDGITVDKHSTGGVGDKTTLIIAPLVAACGGKVAKMSGRGLSSFESILKSRRFYRPSQSNWSCRYRTIRRLGSGR